MVWDKQELLDRLMNNDEIVPVLLNAFVEDGPNTLNDLKAAVECGDSELIMRQAHTLKGMAANLAATSLAEVSRQLEHASKAEGHQQVVELMGELEISFNQVMERFQEELKI